MNRTTKITVIAVSILLVSLCTIAATYSVIVEVTKNNGLTEIINEIHVRDILTDDSGNYNQTYYDLKNELQLTDKEATILMESPEIDNALKKVLQSIVDYKVDNLENAKFSDQELYELISDAVLHTNNISDETKSKIINKSKVYIKDVSKYIYDIEVSYIKDLV